MWRSDCSRSTGPVWTRNMSYIRSADEGVSVCVGSERLERFTSSLAHEFSVLEHWLPEQRRHFTVSSVNVQYQYAAERFVSGPSGSPYQSSPSCCCQLGEQKVLSSGLQEGDITTTGCNENPLHGTAGQSERSLSREQDDVNQSGPPWDAEARLNNLPVYRDETDPVLCIRPVRKQRDNMRI